ncbi:MAG: hypothetical protein WCR71_02295 [Bacteroidales bacterium]
MKNILLFILVILSSTAICAQELNKKETLTTPTPYNSSINLDLSTQEFSSINLNTSAQDYSYSAMPKMNFIKINLAGLPIRNYSLQYERVLNKMLSVSLSYRNMPKGNLPFKSRILNSFDANDIEGRNIINNLTISNYAITPEVRFYLGKKGYGQGLYLAPFFRNAKYECNNFDVTYKDDNGIDQTLSISGNIKSNTFGLLFGAQWFLSKYIVLDWWILGPHIGKGKGDLIGLSSQPLSEEAQKSIRETLEDFDVPFVDKTVTVTKEKAIMNLDGMFGGLRAGLSLGIKF